MSKLKAPFPWFGGKSRCAHLVWERFGNTVNYVEPFAGSLAVLLGRPGAPRNETVNDKDCFISNFWRALKYDPEQAAAYANWPVNEADLHARHQWLHQQKGFIEKMHSDPDYYDCKIAGWWVWGISCWIGDNWCNVNKNMSIPRLKGRAGIQSEGLWQGRPQLGRGSSGVGALKRPHITKGGKGINRKDTNNNLIEYFKLLQDRLERVRVCCGEWHRILGPSPTTSVGTTAVFLDPPYGDPRRDTLYNKDSFTIAQDVLKWCTEHSDEKKLRIALCGFEGEHNELENIGWTKIAWMPGGGYGARNKENENRKLERIWFSESCIDPEGRFF